MLRPEAPAFAGFRPIDPAAVRSPAANAAWSGTSSAYRSLQGEIADYIVRGSPSAALPALSAEGRLMQARLSSPATPPSSPVPSAAADQRSSKDDPRADFLDVIGPLARQAGERLGVAPEIIAAQAALESGWGRRPLRDADGADTHNLFGVKASTAWRGASVEAPTIEVEDGAAVKKVERFRRYGDAADAFRDFTALLQTSPRYQAALNTGDDVTAYGAALAAGGYATDPDYAAKLAAVVARLRAAKD